MAVPKKRTAPSKRNHRRSHHAKKALHLATCPKCSNPVPAHTACPTCGTYKGVEAINVTKKLEKQEKKRKEKAREQQG